MNRLDALNPPFEKDQHVHVSTDGHCLNLFQDSLTHADAKYTRRKCSTRAGLGSIEKGL